MRQKSHTAAEASDPAPTTVDPRWIARGQKSRHTKAVAPSTPMLPRGTTLPCVDRRSQAQCPRPIAGTLDSTKSSCAIRSPGNADVGPDDVLEVERHEREDDELERCRARDDPRVPSSPRDRWYPTRMFASE